MTHFLKNRHCRWMGTENCHACREKPSWRASVGTPDVCPEGVGTRIGLGDIIAKVATPIARALKLPCIDPKTKDLRPESGCAKRKRLLNKISV